MAKLDPKKERAEVRRLLAAGKISRKEAGVMAYNIRTMKLIDTIEAKAGGVCRLS
ncbi:MAG TPA: hypothetical protein PK280_14075 [Planctomycetota bacterium]|nr:hypothetical protein [Planctomycetota bacterium]